MSYRNSFSVLRDAIRPLRAFESLTVEFRNWPAARDVKGTEIGARNFKTTARLLGPNEDRQPAPGLGFIWHGISYVHTRRQMK